MKNEKANIILLLGCQRSGTTLLASMLGGHSEINMLFESTGDDVLKLIGKKYSGNKLLTWRQIRKSQRASKFGHLVNRLANFDFKFKNKHHSKRVYPISKLSIEDYLERGATIISIFRNKEDVVNSITKRTSVSREIASKEYDLAYEILNSLKEQSINVQFSDLVKQPEKTLETVCNALGLEFEERMLEGPKYNFVYPNKSVIKNK